MDAEQLLVALADGQAHSGEDLAHAFGVTRAAVWKHIAKLADWGLAVEAVPGVGYKLRRGVDLLDAGALRSALAPNVAARIATLDVFTELESTNRHLLAARPAVPRYAARVHRRISNGRTRPPRPPLEHAARRRPVSLRRVAVRGCASRALGAHARGRRGRAPRARARGRRGNRAEVAERSRVGRAQARRHPARAHGRRAGRLLRRGRHRHECRPAARAAAVAQRLAARRRRSREPRARRAVCHRRALHSPSD